MKRTPLKRMSSKRRQSLEQRADVREAVLARDGGCQFWHHVWECGHPEPLDFGNQCPQFCTSALHVHEVTPRGTHPGSELDPGVCVTLCAGHHAFIHSRPLLGYQTGLLKRWSAQ
jgi:5-methylcytosine-specific restriction endonuclease McrA